MWVVAVGIVPVIWLYINAKLAQKSEEDQSAFWVGTVFVVCAILFYIGLTASLNSKGWGLLLCVPVAIAFAIIVLTMMCETDKTTNQLKEEEGYGSAIVYNLKIIGVCLIGIIIMIMLK
jgi:hypothetical protein